MRQRRGGRRLAATSVAVAITVGAIGLGASPTGAAPPVGTTAETCFVDAVLPIFYRRPPTTAERDDALARLATGTRGDLVRSLGRSDAWVRAEVTELYRQILDREPDAAGLAYWADRLRRGAKVEELGAAIWSSPEMRARIEGGTQGFVGSVFLRVVGRTPTLAERSYWVPVTEAKGWAWVARQMYRSAEARGRRVERLYVVILGRAPEPAGRTFWVERLLAVNDVELAIQLAASPELLARSIATCAPPGTVTSDLPAASVPIGLSADGTMVLLRSGRADLVPGDTNGSSDLFVFDRVTQAITRVWDNQAPGAFPDGILSGDGTTVVFIPHLALDPGDTDGDDSVYRWNRVTGITDRISDDVGEVQIGGWGASPSADGSRVAWAAAGGVARVWDEDDGEVAAFPYVDPADPDPNDPTVAFVDLSADGTTLLWKQHTIGFCCTGISFPANIRLKVGDVASGTATTVGSLVLEAFWLRASISGDGGHVAFFDWRDGSDGVFRWERASGTTRRVGVLERTDSSDAWISDDGTRIAFGSSSGRNAPGDLDQDPGDPLNTGDDVFLWDATQGGASLVVDRFHGRTWSPILSGDGRHIVYAQPEAWTIWEQSPPP